MRKASRRGSVLIVCLGILVVLSLASAAFISTIQLYRDASKGTQSDVVVRRGLIRACATVLSAIKAEKIPRSDGTTTQKYIAGADWVASAPQPTQLGSWIWDKDMNPKPTGNKLYWRAWATKWSADVNNDGVADGTNPDLGVGAAGPEEWPDKFDEDHGVGFYHVVVEAKLADAPGSSGVAEQQMDFVVYLPNTAAANAVVLWRRLGAELPAP